MVRKLLKSCVYLAVFLLPASVIAEVPFSPDQSFGSAIPESGSVKTLKQAIADAAETPESPLKISGLITEVCQARGCWMILVDGDSHARIFFEDYGFFVPTDTSMQRAVLYGTISEQTLSHEEAEHLAEDAGRKALFDQGEQIREYTILAQGVQIENKI